MGRRLQVGGRDQTNIEGLAAKAWDDLGPFATAPQVEARIRSDNASLWERWTEATPNPAARHKFINARRPPRGARPSRHAKGAARVRGVPRPPLWIIGKDQRLDLRPEYSPVPADYVGSFPPFLLNRGKRTATDIVVKIGSAFVLTVSALGAGERTAINDESDSESFHRLTALVGGTSAITQARFGQGPFKEFRPLVTITFRYGGVRVRKVGGELWVSPKRFFYKFKPTRGRATPIY